VTAVSAFHRSKGSTARTLSAFHRSKGYKV